MTRFVLGLIAVALGIAVIINQKMLSAELGHGVVTGIIVADLFIAVIFLFGRRSQR